MTHFLYVKILWELSPQRLYKDDGEGYVGLVCCHLKTPSTRIKASWLFSQIWERQRDLFIPSVVILSVGNQNSVSGNLGLCMLVGAFVFQATAERGFNWGRIPRSSKVGPTKKDHWMSLSLHNLSSFLSLVVYCPCVLWPRLLTGFGFRIGLPVPQDCEFFVW